MRTVEDMPQRDEAAVVASRPAPHPDVDRLVAEALARAARRKDEQDEPPAQSAPHD